MDYNNYSIDDIFNDFIEILITQKDIAIKSTPNNAEINASNISQKLSDFITSMNYTYSNLSLNTHNTLLELQYALVALSDEIFLNLEWPGKNFWKANLLEIKFSKSQSAGETIFKKIDSILTRKNFLSTETAIIYLKLLALGFQGKYRGEKSHHKLSDYKNKLYIFITSNSTNTVTYEQIFPDGYKSILTGLPRIFMRNEYSVDHIFYTFLVLFLIGTSIFWKHEHLKLQEVLTILDSTNGEKNG